ncbi:MAG: hypothetical protein IM638_09035 [Bacteroidetes bacterium]|nr:hypothetical protein [Bacteroidota bacterium]
MTSAQLRAQIAQYVHQVDEEYLTVLKVILEDRLKVKKAGAGFFTKEEENELERREGEYLKGNMPSDTLEVVNERVLKYIRRSR